METINKIKVSNMQSPRGGTVANQFKIRTDAGKYFQSYDSVIVFRPWGEITPENPITLDSQYWDYSTTTGKYRNMFLGEDKKETLKKINDGTYVLSNLN